MIYFSKEGLIHQECIRFMRTFNAIIVLKCEIIKKLYSFRVHFY